MNGVEFQRLAGGAVDMTTVDTGDVEHHHLFSARAWAQVCAAVSKGGMEISNLGMFLQMHGEEPESMPQLVIGR